MEIFDAMAQNYDTADRRERAKIIADKIRTQLCGGREKSAIEYGCGTGLVGLQLVDDFKTLKLVDSSAEMIKQVSRKLQERSERLEITALCCDFMCDTSVKLQADCIFSSLVLHHIQDTEMALRRMHDRLNDGGHLLVVDLDEEDGSFHSKYPDFDGHNGFNHSVLISQARSAGLSAVTVETFYQGRKVFNGKTTPYMFFILNAVK